MNKKSDRKLTKIVYLASSVIILIVISIFTLTLSIEKSRNTNSSIAGNVNAMTIPPDRRIEWHPGIPGGIPNYPVGLNAANFGANGNDTGDDTAAIRNAIQAAAPNTAVLIPQGTYYLSGTLTLNKSNIALRGEGFQKTKLIFTSSSGKLLEFNSQWGCTDSSWVNTLSGYTKGSNVITVDNAGSFRVGGYAVLREDNDPNLYICGYSGCGETWMERSIGQVFKIKQIIGNTISFEQPLNVSYRAQLNPKLCPNPMVEKSGIEEMYIEQRQSTGSGYNFQFHDTAFCWLKNVRSEKSLNAHVFFDTSLGNEIRGNYFNDSFLHNSGGQGYGIRTEGQSTANLIEDNIFNHLRHSMVVSLGANGNVFGYNFSRNPYSSQSPGWLSQDIAVHGIYSYQNLFEGNTVQEAVIDNVWGTNGPTTIFRNRIEKDLNNIDANISSPQQFAFIEVAANNPYQNIIGNEMGIAGSTATTPLKINSGVLSTTFEACNYATQNQRLWGSTDCNIPASYYLAAKPAFLGNLPWPPLGGDIAPNTNIIPAQKRYRDGTYIPSNSVSLPTSTPPTTVTNTLTPTRNPSLTPPQKPGDVNRDGKVDILDFQLLSNSFGKSSGQSGFNANADFNHDNSINILDFQILSNNFGR